MVPVVETELDRRQRERVKQSQRERAATVAAEGQGATDTAPAVDTAPKPAPRKCDRWATFNTFTDVIAPRLTLAERAVWGLMFRHTRNGICETSVRMLATAGGIGRATADRALRQLCAYGLVRAVWKSRDKSKASKYAINPHPDRCIGSLPTIHEPSSP